jgi:DNA ligase-1
MNEKQMQHGFDWAGSDLTGWHVTEKFDGCRAYWDGSALWSRGGMNINIPEDILAALPSHELDCEIYDGVDGRSRCSVAARWGRFTDTMRLVVFDAPGMAGDQAERLAACGVRQASRVHVAPLWTATSTDAAIAKMLEIQSRGGEGVMCSEPGSQYTRARVRHLLKLKTAGDLAAKYTF